MIAFDSWRVVRRMQLLVGLTLAGLFVLCIIALLQLKESMLEDRKQKTKNLVEVAAGIVQRQYQLAKEGKQTDAEAQQAAKDNLRGLRYGGSDYFFINDVTYHHVMVPPRPELEGHDGSGLKDSNGILLVQELVKSARTGRGFTEYTFPRPGQDKPEPKLSYTVFFEPWGWAIGTGIYISDVEQEYRRDAAWLGAASLLLLALLSVVGWRVGSSVVRQLGGEPAQAASAMLRVADGDLGVDLGTPLPGSLLHALAAMVASLRAMIGQIDTDAGRLIGNAEQINRAAVEVATAAERQSDATASMAAAIEELTVSSGHIAERSRDTESDSTAAMTLASEGSARVENATDAIQKSAATVADASARISALEERARQVTTIANVIKEIAGQTNLLALNAAIEAARAGEQGRGFAVVADEVRKLAERTSLATTEIEETISGIQSDTVAAVDAMHGVLPEVEQGVDLARSASTSLREIEEGAGRTLERVRQVVEATQEQGAASVAIAQRVEHIAQMVEETTATIRSTADAAAELEQIAQSLRAQIGRFRV